MNTLVGTVLQPVSPTQCTISKDMTVRIDAAGRIAEIAAASAGNGADIVGGPGCWIIPGFIDGHLHLPEWDRRGIDGLSALQWQTSIGAPAEERLARRETASALAEEFTRGLIAHGTTTIAAFGSTFPQEVDASFAIFAQHGLRAIYGLTLNDVDMPAALMQQADKALDEARALAVKWHGKENGRLLYAFSPRTSIRCSDKLLRGAAALADMLKCYVQTHVADAADERAEVQRRYPEQIDELDVLAEMGILGRRTLLAHGAFLEHHHHRAIIESGTALVHCPTANLFRESGLTDITARRTAGGVGGGAVRMALGSGIGGGFEPFMPRVAVESLQTAKAIKVHALPRRAVPAPTPAEAWWMLTAGGAAALALGDHVGRLTPGYQADLLLVRPETWIADLPPDQQISALLYTLTPQHIEHVLIAGKRVGP